MGGTTCFLLSIQFHDFACRLLPYRCTLDSPKTRSATLEERAMFAIERTSLGFIAILVCRIRIVASFFVPALMPAKELPLCPPQVARKISY
jgi:hypothetical protein